MVTLRSPRTYQPFPSIWFCFQLHLGRRKLNPVHSEMLFCQGFFFRHLLLPPCTVPCKSPDDLDTCPNHFNLCFFRGHEIIIGHNCLPDSVSDSIVSDLISVRDAKEFPKVSHLSGLQFLLTVRQIRGSVFPFRKRKILMWTKIFVLLGRQGI